VNPKISGPTADLLHLTAKFGQLKETVRTGWTRSGISPCESVAEHSYRMAMMAITYGSQVQNDDPIFDPMAITYGSQVQNDDPIFDPIFNGSTNDSRNDISNANADANTNDSSSDKKPSNKLDVNACVRMCLTHDLAEAITGDIVTESLDKTKNDGVTGAEKEILEANAMEEIFRVKEGEESRKNRKNRKSRESEGDGSEDNSESDAKRAKMEETSANNESKEDINEEASKNIKEESDKNMENTLFAAKSELVSLWRNYENQDTPEARFVKDIDKLECCIQAFEYEQRSRGIQPTRTDDQNPACASVDRFGDGKPLDLNTFFVSAQKKIKSRVCREVFERIWAESRGLSGKE
jgi:5'-deoxynucleotidase YfbR-like HD superfamily hydrolase